MRLGNVTGDIYDRSIRKKRSGRGAGICNGADYGEDCAIFSCGGKYAAVAMSQTAYTGADCGKYAVFAAANQAAARGVQRPDGILLRILLPVDGEEGALRRLVADADRAADCLRTGIADVKVSVLPAVREPIVSAMAAGQGLCGVESWENPWKIKPYSGEEMEQAEQIVMTKWAGLEGSALLASRHRERLCIRYPADLIDEATGFGRFLSIKDEAAIAWDLCGGRLCAAAEGGVFRALWTLAECAKTGLEVDLKKIPIRQETVEICNELDCNPYELLSNGSLLCLTGHGEALLQALGQKQIPAAIIGKAIRSHDRVIVNGSERRFLEPAKPDAFYRF